MRTAAVDGAGRALAFAALPTRAQDGPEAIVAQIVASVARVRAEVPGCHILGLGVGAPGPLDPAAGIAIAPPTLAGWHDVLATEAHWLGVGIVNLLHLYSPERVVLGGGVGSCLDLMQAGIDRTIQARAMAPYRDVPVVAAQLGANAGLIGAASLVFQER